MTQYSLTEPASECQVCFSVMVRKSVRAHMLFHSVNDQHAATCGQLRRAISQRGTGAYLHPVPCDCVLGEWRAAMTQAGWPE